MNEYLRLILAILTCYRLARMLALDDGPLFLFKRLRYWAKDRAWAEAVHNGYIVFHPNEPNAVDDRWFGHWHNLAEGLSCPFCVGMWLSLPLFLLVLYPTQNGDLFLILISISAGQALLQSLERK